MTTVSLRAWKNFKTSSAEAYTVINCYLTFLFSKLGTEGTFYLFFLEDSIYLSERMSERESAQAGVADREGEADSVRSREPHVGFRNHDLSPRQNLNPLNHPRAPVYFEMHPIFMLRTTLQVYTKLAETPGSPEHISVFEVTRAFRSVGR